MKKQLFASLLLSCSALDVSAGWWRHELIPDISYDLGTIVLSNPSDNVAGHEFSSAVPISVNGFHYKTLCDNGTYLSTTGRPIFMTAEYVNGAPVYTDSSGRNYVPVNDYLQAALTFRYNSTSFNFPAVNQYFGMIGEQCNTEYPHSGMTTFTLNTRITRPFVGFAYYNLPIGRIYQGDDEPPAGSAKRNGAAQTIYLKARVTVQQSCTVNNGIDALVDFGDIPSYRFKQTGAGNRPNGTAKANIALSITCNSFVASNAPLSVRVQTDNVAGSANDTILSNNPDIGFKMSDQNDNILIPNNINSKIHFTNTNPANVVVKAWPVSVTGNQPAAGPFQARGYFRIDFD